MKRSLQQTFIILLVFSYSARAQEYSYTHYDVSDGLAGSVVYCITQDKGGFIWVGTETGVSRFDGTHFRTFTVADGLPDIEVLQLFGDSKGRVWMAPFRKSICYYYRGRIHNQENDSVLHRIHLRENVGSFAEDAAGNILVQERTALQLIAADGTVRQIDSIAGQPIRSCAAVSRSASGNFLVQDGQDIFTFSARSASLYCSIRLKDVEPAYLAMNPTAMIWRMDLTHSAVRCFATGRTTVFPFERAHYKHYSFTSAGDSLFYYNELSGSLQYNTHTGETKRFLPGVEVSRTFQDATGNTWFTTMGQGLYRLNSDEFRTIRINPYHEQSSAVHAIVRMGNKLLVGDGHNQITVFTLPDFRSRLVTCRRFARNRVLYISEGPRHRILVGADGGISYCCQPTATWFTGIKAIVQKNDSELLVATSWGAARFDPGRLRLIDTIWRERSTCIYYRMDSCYIGTLNGLFRIGPDHRAVYLGDAFPFLKKRISAVEESPDHTLWVASYDAGLVGFKNGHISRRIGVEQGLTSNICRTILIHGQILWVGTDKGLNKVDLSRPDYPILQYTSNDGLGSNTINSIYADSSRVFVGTPAGLSYFDASKVNISEGCRLHLLAFINGGRDKSADSNHLEIPYQDKHIRIEFVGISYRSVGSIRYRYRLLGLDSGWQETKETFLDYPTLPSGKYTLQLQAINKFGNGSALLSLPFEIATPVWQTGWFYACIVVGFLLLVWFVVSLRIKSIRRRQMEKEQLNRRLAELENTALKSQMNPHFIFNCLTSIQHYIFEHDTMAANKYLTGFARLIRATLYNSSRAFISLSDEVDYLTNYLSLEKLRFKEKMDYTVEMDQRISKDSYLIPPMLIQPFVENSIRHGLRHKTNGKGLIRVDFSLAGTDRLAVTIEDNGIGRKKAAGYKTKEHISYQSKGMTLTTDRVRMMNSKFDGNIAIEVIDLENGTDEPAGTRVVIRFPLFHLTEQTQYL